jgi:phage shock protein PspC (stress-responsive transcriptional regulator)
MNEITNIHLGRQAYTISVEAHNELKSYISSIKKHVADKELIDEVELRMSELLSERGIDSKKVVLPKDIEFLKEQLGQPEDFGDDSEESDQQKSQEQAPRRLFRNTDDMIIAGVASGIASYFGLEAALVRILFVVLAIFGGGIGIVIYIVFWLALPPAVTASEKLQMSGKPVTLEELKKSVSATELPNKARKINRSLSTIINRLFRVMAKLAGVGMILTGLAIVSTVTATKAYMLLHGGKLFQENLFPVGYRENWLMAIAMILMVFISIFLVLAGIAIIKRKWPLRAWLTGGLVGLFLIGSVSCFVLAADAAPRINERYQTSLHTTAIKDIQPFNKIVKEGDLDISYVSAPNYAVNLHYSDNPDLTKVKVSVKDGTLYVDSRDLDGVKHCTMLCLFPRYNMTLQVYAPNIENFVTSPNTDIFYPAPSVLN